MQIQKFWSLIEAAKEKIHNDCWKFAPLLEEFLEKLPEDEIIDFDRILDDLLKMSYRNDLWAAAYIINAGCSDDGFLYFRAWLIAQGEQIFYNALKDPETLADIGLDPDITAECEQLLYAAMHAYKEKTGTDMPDYSGAHPDLVGQDWSEEDLDTMFPKLSSIF